LSLRQDCHAASATTNTFKLDDPETINRHLWAASSACLQCLLYEPAVDLLCNLGRITEQDCVGEVRVFFHAHEVVL